MIKTIIIFVIIIQGLNAENKSLSDNFIYNDNLIIKNIDLEKNDKIWTYSNNEIYISNIEQLKSTKYTIYKVSKTMTDTIVLENIYNKWVSDFIRW